MPSKCDGPGEFQELASGHVQYVRRMMDNVLDSKSQAAAQDAIHRARLALSELWGCTEDYLPGPALLAVRIEGEMALKEEIGG